MIELRRLTNLKVKVIQVDAAEVQKAIQYYYKGVGDPPSPSQGVGPQKVGPLQTKEATAVRPRPAAPVLVPLGPPMYAIWVPREDAMSIARVGKEDVAGDWDRTYAADQPILAGKITR